MITDALFGIVFGLIDLLLTPLLVLDFNFNISSIEPVLQYFKMAGYLIPFAQLSPVFFFFVSLMTFRIAVSLIKTIWNLLPVL